MRRTLLYTNYLIPCRLSTDPEMYDLGWLAWMFIIRNSIGCGQCLRPKMLSDIFSFSFPLLLPNWLLISIRIYSGIARFPCDSMAFLFYICNKHSSCHDADGSSNAVETANLMGHLTQDTSNRDCHWFIDWMIRCKFGNKIAVTKL